MALRAASVGAGLVALCLGGPAQAGEPSPEPDEKCIEQCDVKADECMQATNGDPDKMQACDDQYGECLEACPAS